jgi:uncharacterized phiE125 gp8 family phage protein
MFLSLLEAPEDLPVELADAKAHARVEVDNDDALISGLIRAATSYAETYTQRALLTQQWEMQLDAFAHDCRWIEIPKPPLITLDGILYLDGNGDEQVWGADNYRVIAPKGPTAAPARVVLKHSLRWPTVLAEPNSIFVRFTAGYGVLPHDVPDDIVHAIKVHVAEMYENRESTVLTGAVLQEVPFSVNHLLWPYVVDKFGL